jgi:hypothetical protein
MTWFVEGERESVIFMRAKRFGEEENRRTASHPRSRDGLQARVTDDLERPRVSQPGSTHKSTARRKTDVLMKHNHVAEAVRTSWSRALARRALERGA